MENREEEPSNLNTENKDDNSKPEDKKRKTCSNEEDNDNNYDPLSLSLSLSPYSERRVKARPIINSPNMEHQQQHMSSHTSSSPRPQLPFHPPPPPVMIMPPPTVFGIPLLAPAPLPSPIPDGLISEGRANNDKDEKIIIVPPFPWATDRPAKVHTMQHLVQNKIFNITGNVQCGSCHRKFEMSLDLVTKFREVIEFMGSQGDAMHNRAPEEWKHPILPGCEHCGVENSVKPIIGDAKDHSINWLFMFLGQLIGSCTLEHLRYFCHHNSIHRSGAKDRVLYLTYTRLMQQLLGKA